MADAIVDVLVPIYNGGVYVESALRSILQQTLKEIRLIVIDDGSTDGTPGVLRMLAAEDKRVHVLTKANGGIVDALNAGLALCNAEFVARHDADDLALPRRLEHQLSFLRANNDVIAIGSSARHIDPEGKSMGTFARFPSTDKANALHIPAKEPYLLHPFLMVKRDAIQSIGGYRHVVHAEDADLYWRLQEVGKLHSDRSIQGDYRIHPLSVSSRSIQNGRVAALSSQLCALSAIRRRSGQPDLVFSRCEAQGLKDNAESLEALCQSVQSQLSQPEYDHVRLSTGVKLLELSGYRPYVLEESDCHFLSSVFDRSSSSVKGSNRGILLRMFSGTAARLASQGMVKEAQILIKPGMKIPFTIRLALRRVLSGAVHKRMRALVAPWMYFVRGA